MSRPKSIPRTIDGFFISICPICKATKKRKSYPPKKQLPCSGCTARRRPHLPCFVLATEDIESYKKGNPASFIAKRRNVVPATILSALRRHRVTTRTMSEAGKLFPHLDKLQSKANELRKSGQLSILMSCGLQGITTEKWTGFKKDEWSRKRASAEWKLWREQVFERDGYKCCECGKNHTLSPHHIRKKSTNPELLYSVINGITLCAKCHMKTFHKEEDFIVYFDSIIRK